MATTNKIQKLLSLAGKFIAERNGEWNHGDWETFLDEAGKLGFDHNDEAKRNLGNMLEAGKYFYHVLPATTTKKAATKSKAKPKAKAKAKAKTKAKS